MKRMTAIGLCVILLFAAALPLLAACDPQEVPEWGREGGIDGGGRRTDV